MIQNDQISAVEDTLLQVVAADGVLANDTTANGPLTVVEEFRFTAAGGQIEFLADGSYQYISAPGFSGTDSVQYTAIDALSQAAIGTLTINVAAAALLPFVSVGTQLSDQHVVTNGFGQIGNGIATQAGRPVPLSGGGYVIAIDYLDQANGTIYRVQTYDADNHLVSTFDPGQRIFDLRIAPLSNGNYAIGWDTGGGPTERTTHVELFNAAGTSLAAPVTIDVPGINDTLSNLAALPGGGFLTLQSAVGVQLYARSFGANGTPDPQPFAVGTSTQLRNPTILPDGEIVLIRTVNNNEVHVQRYDAHGNTIGSEIVPVSDGNPANSIFTTARPGGGFFLSWMSIVSGGSNPEQISHIQIVDANGGLVGTPVTTDFTFTTLFGAPKATVTPLADGGFVVSWRGTIDGGIVDRVQAYDANRNAVGGPIEFTSFGPFGTTRALVYALPDGGFAVSLQSADPANHNLLIYDNGGNAVGEVRMHDASDGTGFSSIVLANLPNGKTLVMSDAFSGTAGTSHNTVQTLDFSGSSTPIIHSGITFNEDTTGTIPVMISIPDSDGSEIVQSIDVAGIPAGWTLSYPSATAVLNGGVWTVTGAGIAHGGEIDLLLKPPLDVNGSATLTVTAHTVDTVNNSQNQSVPVTFNVTVTPAPHLTGTSGDDSYTALPDGERIDALGGVDTITFGFKLVDATISFVGNQVIVDGPNSHTVLTGFEIYKFTDGTVNNNDSDPLVDDLFYYSKYHDVWNAHVDADAHFHASGWHEVRDPNAFFSTSTYLSLNPSVKSSGVDPLVQYDQAGWKTGADPSIAFDTNAYLKANPDVKAAGIDPLAHFLQYGEQEGRQPIAPSVLLAPNGFDYVYYLQHNPDVAAAHVDALQHFETIGWKEGRNPNALFDDKGYLAAYLDVAAAGINPLDHYNQFGWKEGRDPSANFDTTDYLSHYTDVASAQINPLIHFLQFGQAEGRSPFADGHFG
jgi:hypothetical protein